jgi:hypothetical protein
MPGAEMLVVTVLLFILWHADPLLGNHRKISGYTTAVTEQWLHKLDTATEE